jgi:hypothetical protein
MDARSLIVPLLVSVAGCAADPDQDVPEATQIGARVVSAKGLRVDHAPLPWAAVEAHVDELELERFASVLEFFPDEGVYALAQQLVRVDACGLTDGSAELDHEIRNVDPKAGTYQDHLVARGEAEPTLAVGCELSDRVYRCNSSTTTIDFAVLGLAAKVTVQNDSFGIWSGAAPAFIGAFPYELSCEGADCDKPPASDLFGLMTGRMPCVGIEVAKFAR